LQSYYRDRTASDLNSRAALLLIKIIFGEHQSPSQDFHQVWFSGVHSDVGGSYKEHASGLSKITLEWMLIKAKKAGLGVEDAKARVVLGQVPIVLLY
jgi:hypothetical protein